MALDGEVAGVQMGEAGEGEWCVSTEEEAGLEEEKGLVEEGVQVEAASEEDDNWLERARLVAQAGVRKVVGVAKFGSRRAEQRSVRQVLKVVEVSESPQKSRNVCTCLTLFDPPPRIDGDENRVRDEGIRVVTVRHCDNHHFTVVPTV